MSTQKDPRPAFTEASGSPEGIDHESTNSPVCPECGYVFRDAWEWNFGPCLEGDYEKECDCGCTFIAEREVCVTYSTTVKVSRENHTDIQQSCRITGAGMKNQQVEDGEVHLG